MDDHNVPELPLRPRRFVYRAAQAETSLAHPLRRSTDHPPPFQPAAAASASNVVLLQFRVCLKVN